MSLRACGAALAALIVVACGRSSIDRDGGTPDRRDGDVPDAGVPDSGASICAPGAVDQLPCGRCGIERRRCDASGVWQSEGCVGEGVCEQGSTRDVACGNCGTATELCDATCQWSPATMCVGEGCAPGTRTRTGEGCPPGQEREIACNGMCELEAISACTDQVCSTVGARETLPCGTRCGTLERVCGPDNLWAYGACMNEGVCSPGERGTAACGNCGTQSATCGASCAFAPDPGGVCTGEGVCAPGTMQPTSVGCLPFETRMAPCDATCALGAGGTCAPAAPAPFVVVPFGGPPTPDRVTVRAVAAVAFADVYFLVDITGSMSGEIAALRGAMSTLVDDLQCANSGTPCTEDAECAATEVCSGITGTCIEDPAISRCVASLWTGAGYYEADYVNVQSLQASAAVTSSALMLSTFGGIEELYEALVGVSDPSLVTPTPMGCTSGGGTVGCPAFRPATQRIVIAFTDEDSDGPTTAPQVRSALSAAGITLIGVWSGVPGSAARAELDAVVSSAGGAPLIYEGRDAAVVAPVQTALNTVLNGIPVRASVTLLDDPTDAVDARAFVDHVEVNTSAPGCAAEPAVDTNADGFPDTFTMAPAGTRICFDVVARSNTSVMEASEPQVFPLTAVVLGNGAVIQRRTISFIVPAAP